VYLYSLLSPSTFEGAHGNLVRLLERSRRRYQELNDQPTAQKGLSLEQQMYAMNVHLLLFKLSLVSHKVLPEGRIYA